MNEFYDDVRDKKRTAASARHRVCGSRSQKVTLPSDNMTKAELEKMSGPVMTYSLKQPMTWERLRNMPSDLQKQYIKSLRDDYNANPAAIAQMLGVCTNTLRTLTTSLCIAFPRGGGCRMSDSDREKWHAFLAGQPAPEKAEPEYEEPKNDEPAPAPSPEKVEAVMTAGTVTFHGPTGAALRMVYDLLGERPGRLTVSWEFDEEA